MKYFLYVGILAIGVGILEFGYNWGITAAVRKVVEYGDDNPTETFGEFVRKCREEA